MSRENREFEVELVVTTNHLFTTFARTPEEAENTVEGMLEDGDLGEITGRTIESIEAIPIEDITEESEDEDYEEEELDDFSD